MELDSPDEKGITKRQHLNKAYEQSGVLPRELEEEIMPEFWDEPIFEQFFDIFQRGHEFYQTVYYYQRVMETEFDGEELTLLRIMWDHVNQYINEKEKKEHNKRVRQSKKPSSGRRRRR